MGLTESLNKEHKIQDVKRVQYFDTRYYKVAYQEGKKLIEEYLPSVTEILGAYPKEFLARWRGDVGNERADQIVFEALNLGSFIHYGAEILVKGGAVVFHPPQGSLFSEEEITKLKKNHNEVALCRRQQEYIQLHRIWQFFQILKPTKIDTEQTVYSIKHQYAGTLDLIMWVEGGVYEIAGGTPVKLETGYYIGDYKTGKGVSITYLMQLAAYMEAVMEGSAELRKHLKGGLIIHPNNELIKKGIVGLKTTVLSREEQPVMFNNFMKTYAVYSIEHPVPTPNTTDMPAYLSLTPKNKATKRRTK